MPSKVVSGLPSQSKGLEQENLHGHCCSPNFEQRAHVGTISLVPDAAEWRVRDNEVRESALDKFFSDIEEQKLQTAR